MNYPRYRDSFNLYIGGTLILEDAKCPPHPNPKAASYDSYPEVVLLPLLKEKTCRSDWTETKESKEGMYQQGLRGVFEFRNDDGQEAAFFVRAAQASNLTNIAPARP